MTMVSGIPAISNKYRVKLSTKVRKDEKNRLVFSLSQLGFEPDVSTHFDAYYLCLLRK